MIYISERQNSDIYNEFVTIIRSFFESLKHNVDFEFSYTLRLLWNTAKEKNFKRYDYSVIDSLGVPYDYGSVMHYSEDAFSDNGKPTIVPKQGGVSIV